MLSYVDGHFFYYDLTFMCANHSSSRFLSPTLEQLFCCSKWQANTRSFSLSRCRRIESIDVINTTATVFREGDGRKVVVKMSWFCMTRTLAHLILSKTRASAWYGQLSAIHSTNKYHLHNEMLIADPNQFAQWSTKWNVIVTSVWGQ